MTAELAGRDVAFVTVMLEGSAPQGRAFADRTRLRAPVILGNRELARHYQVLAYPWTLIIGRDGHALSAIRGGRDEAEFRDTFKKYL